MDSERSAEKQAKVCEMTCLRKIEGVTRSDNIRNEEIRERVGCCQEIDRRTMKCRLKCFGHVNRMSAERCPKIAIYGYVHGKRRKGRPKKRWLDNVEVDCEEMGLKLYEATSRTID